MRPGTSGPTAEGYVYNKTDMEAERSFFRTRVPQAAIYRVTVLSFNWLSKISGI